MLAPISPYSPIEILVNVLLQKYLSTSYCLTIISETALNLQFSSNFMYFVPSDNLVLQLLNASESGCSDYLINMKDPPSFMKAFEEVVHLGGIRRSDRKLLFLPFEQFNNSKLLDVLRMKETSFVPNIVLILASRIDSCNAFDLVTRNFVSDTAEHLVYLDQWDICKQKFVRDANLFPYNISDLQGKTVKVAAFTYTPYVVLDINDKVTPGGIDGTDIRVIQEFCKWVNCTIEIVRDDEHEWGEIYDNQTGTGVLGNVIEDRSDFGITALYSWFEEFKVLDFSASCVRTSITCIAPSPRLLVSMQTPLLPFTIQMWLALIVTYIFSCIALAVAQGFSLENVFLQTFAMMITQSQREVGVSWRIRSVTAWLLVTGLIIDNAYGGGLASVFTVPKYEPSIDTIKDIVDRNMEWGATHDAWVFSLTLSEDELIKKVVRQFRTYSPKELERKSYTRSMAFSIEKLPAGYFAIGDYITEEAVRDMTLMLEDFYYEYTVVMMRKSSPYTEKMSALVLRLHQSGLMLAWERQIALKYLNYNVQLEVKLSRTKRDVSNVEPLNLGQVSGIFLFYVAGTIIATVLFLLEYFCSKTIKVVTVYFVYLFTFFF